jgi:hypothetical protein
LLNSWNVVANSEYIERIKQVIFHLHGSDSTHVKTVPVHEVFKGQTVWQGEVEVFDLLNHPKAKRCYAWSADKKDKEKFTTVLEIPPVDSPVTAVRVSIVAATKNLK